MESIKIDIDYSNAEKAAAQLERLAEAADRAKTALAGLNEELHGGATIQMVGDVCRVDILPYKKADNCLTDQLARSPNSGRSYSTNHGL